MNVKEIMSKPAVTCRPHDNLNTAAQLMWEHDCGVVPIIGDDDRVVGIVTDRDICMAAYIQGKALSEIAVTNAMAEDVATIRSGDSIEAAEKLMSDRQIRRLPVVDDDNRPIGVLSLNDLARHAASSRKKNGLDREVTRTLASICTPRSEQTTKSRSRSRTSPRASM